MHPKKNATKEGLRKREGKRKRRQKFFSEVAKREATNVKVS